MDHQVASGAEIEIRGDIADAGDIDATVRDRLGQEDAVDNVRIYDESGELVGEWTKGTDSTIDGGMLP